MKLIVNAVGVQKLIEHDPEGVLEIAKNASAQVAQELAGRITEKKVTDSINYHLGRVISSGGWKPVITPAVKTLIETVVKDMFRSIMDEHVERQIRNAVNAAVEDALDKADDRLSSNMTDKIDDLIKKRFAAMFGGGGN